VSPARAGGGALVAAALLLGCKAPRFGVEDVPGAPIAFVYRSVEETERVQDELEQEQKKARGVGLEAGRLQVELERLERLTGWRNAEDALRDQLGRVRLYVVPEGRLEAVEVAPRGARPLEWSADRTRLMFSAASRDRLQLFEWIPATGEVRQLTRGEWAHPDGCYGPDGALAYVEVVVRKSRQAAARIWIQRPGEPARAVTEGPADGQPSWSRDGRRIVYAVSDPQRGELLRWVDPASGDGGVLASGRSPVFTPDGAWIVYSGPASAGWKLWRMRADGSGKRNFGKSAFHENDPAVSPDGRFVVFAGTKQERSATSRLFVRPLDGSADRQVEINGSALLPVW
jgi:hypothetical protein